MNRNQRTATQAEQIQRIAVIDLPPSMRSVPHQAQLIVMTNSGSGYGYARGADAAGTIQCPTNFHSIREFLRHMGCHLPCLCENPSQYLFFTRTKGH